MKKISEIYKKELMTSDGRVLGTLKGVAVKKDWTVTGFTVNIDNDAVEELGKKKPFLGTLRMDVGVEHIKAMGDNILLDKPMKEIGVLLKTYHENNDVSCLDKMEIVDSEGRDVGEIDDIFLDDLLWNIPSVLVSVNKDVSDVLKVKKPMFSNSKVSLPTHRFSGVSDKVMLSVTTESFGDILEDVTLKSM